MNRRTHNRNAGFTLIELIIVAAIIGIIAAFAYPAYQDSVQKARRADGKGALLELSQFMERNFTEANRYDLDRAGNAVALPFDESPAGADAGDRFYTITLSNLAVSTFQLNAAPANGQTDDKCGTLTFNQAGVKAITGADAGVTAADCW